MKINYDFIKEILSVMEESKKSFTDLDSLIKNLEINLSNENSVHKLRHHLNILVGAFLIKSEFAHNGFRLDSTGGFNLFNINFELTLLGHQTLEAMNNDKVWKKIVGTVKTLGIEGVKQIPALAIALLTSTPK